MRQYFVKTNDPIDSRKVKNQVQVFSEGCVSALSAIGYKLETNISWLSRLFRRSSCLPFILLLASILSTALVNVDALLAPSHNMNTVRSTMASSLSLQGVSKGSTFNYVSCYLSELNSWQQILLHRKHRSSARLLSHMPRYLDQLTLSNTALSNAAPAILGHSNSCASQSHHDTAATIFKENHIAEIIGESSPGLLHNSSLQNTKETRSKVPRDLNILENVFSYDLPEGRCVGLRLHSSKNSASLDPIEIESDENHWIKKPLHADEVQFGIDLPSDHARMAFYVGRLAIRTALSQVSEEGVRTNAGMTCNNISKEQASELLPNVSSLDPSILKDKFGRPQVPEGFIGSISHKKNMGVALVSAVDDNGYLPPTEGVGVDLEQTFTRRKDIAKKVLTKWEIENLGKIPGVTRDEEVLLRFSLKECVYKAMHPLICQWVGFQEAEITPHANGTATVKLNLKSGAHEQLQHVKAHWRRIGEDFFLTSSSVTLN